MVRYICRLFVKVACCVCLPSLTMKVDSFSHAMQWQQTLWLVSGLLRTCYLLCKWG